MLRSAGYRPAQAWVRAGGLAAGRYDSIEMPCVRSRLLRISVGMSCVRSRLLRVSVGMSCVRSRLLCTSVGMSCVRSRLLRISVGMSCVRLTPAPRFCWDVLRSITPAVCRMSAKQDGLREVTFLFRAGRDRLSTFSSVVRLSGLFGSLRDCTFLCGDPDGGRRDAGNGVGGAAWVCFCVSLLALPCFPRGERWGCAPQTAPKSLRLSGLSSWGSRQSTACQTSQ